FVECVGGTCYVWFWPSRNWFWRRIFDVGHAAVSRHRLKNASRGGQSILTDHR
ncbi:hypothetical protein pipiens_000776, partial [Culex pipiens pipiens]